MIGYIYSIASASGRVYIGSTVDPRKRHTEHFRTLKLKSHHNKLLQEEFILQNADVSKFIYNIIGTVEVDTYYDLLCIEGRAIRRVPNELSLNINKFPELMPTWSRNGLPGTFKNKKHTNKARRKMSLNHRDVAGPKNPMYGKVGAMKNKHISNAHKQKISEANTGKTVGENNGNSKLTNVQRCEIWYKRNILKESITKLSSEYFVGNTIIGKISRNLKWKP